MERCLSFIRELSDADLNSLSKAGAAHVEGDLALADRFALIFPRP